MKLSLGLGRDNTRIFLGMIFNEGGLGVYMTLWPIYIASLGASPPQIGLIIGLLGFARLVFLAPSGMLSDRIPPRRLIVLARSMAALGLLLLAFAQTWWHLIPGIMIMSAGTIAFPMLSNVIAENAGSGLARTRAFTLIYSVGPSGALLIAPPLGGLIAAGFGLRAIFVAAAALTAVSVVAFSTMAPKPIAQQDGTPVTYRRALADRPVRLLLLLQFATIFILTAGVTLVPNFLREVHGLTIDQIGWIGGCGAIGSALLGLTINRVRIFQRPLAGIALSVIAVGGMLVLLLISRNFWFFPVAYLLRGGFVVAWSTYYAALGEVTSDRLRGRVYALAELLAGAAMTGAPFVAGWLYDVTPTAPIIAGLLAIGPLLLAIGLAAQTLRPKEDPTPQMVEEGV